MKVALTDFEYDSNIDEILQSYQKVEFMDEHVVIVDESTVGSTISRVFRKSVTDIFSWGLNQSLGVAVEVEASAGIPFIGGIKTTVTTTTQFSSNQQWANSTPYDIEAHAQMTPTKPGTYKMSGFVKMANNVQLQFKCKALVKGFSMRLLSEAGYADGDAATGAELQHALKLLPDFHMGSIVSVEADAVHLSLTGTMRGTYGMSTVTSFKQIA